MHWHPNLLAIFYAPTSNLPSHATAHDVLSIVGERNCTYGILFKDDDRYHPRLANVTGKGVLFARLSGSRQYISSFQLSSIRAHHSLAPGVLWKTYLKSRKKNAWSFARATPWLLAMHVAPYRSIHTPHALGPALAQTDTLPTLLVTYELSVGGITLEPGGNWGTATKRSGQQP